MQSKSIKFLESSNIENFRTIGIFSKTSFEKLQKAISKDFKFESQVQKEWKEAFFQFFSLAILIE